MKKFIVTFPFIIILIFMLWMSNNYLGSLTVVVPEGEILTVKVEGENVQVLERTTTFELWAKGYVVEVSRDGYVSEDYDVRIEYKEDFELTPDLLLEIGLQAVNVNVPYLMKGKFVSSGEYVDDQIEMVMENGMPIRGQQNLRRFPTDAFRAYFNSQMTKALVRSGDLLNERVIVYTVSNGSSVKLEGEIVAVDWSDDGVSLAVLKKVEEQLELGIWNQKDGYVRLRGLKDIAIGEVSYSPVGDRLIIFSKGQMPERNLFVVNILDGKMKQITEGGFVHGFVWVDGERLVIDKAGGGSAVRSLWSKNLISGKEEQLNIGVTISDVVPFANGLVVADRSVNAARLEALREGEKTLNEILGEAGENFDNLNEEQELPEVYYYYDLADGSKRMIDESASADIDTEKMVVASRDRGVYLITKDKIYLLTFEL